MQFSFEHAKPKTPVAYLQAGDLILEAPARNQRVRVSSFFRVATYETKPFDPDEQGVTAVFYPGDSVTITF